MPRKGMRSIFFYSPQKNSSSLNSPSPSRPSPVYSFSNAMIDETICTAEEMIQKWNPETSAFAKVTSLFYESKREAMEFLKIVKDLQRAMRFMVSENSNSERLVRAQHLMQIAMRRLEKEFYQILSTNRDHLDPESISGSRSSLASERSRTSISDFEDDVAGYEDEIQVVSDSISEVEQVSALAMSDLKSIADCMISTGYGRECVKIYKIIRKSIVDEGLYRLGVERSSSHKVQKMDWEVLNLKIKDWLNAAKIAVKTLFTGERILCDHVFSSSDYIRESCFSEISKEGAIMLFQFPELVVKGKKSPEKMFRLLDLYDSISNLWQEIESIFSFESTTLVRSQALTSLIKLSDAVRSLLSDFGTAIQKDSSKSPVKGGGIHPLTTQVMNDVCLLADYSGPLSDILAAAPSPVQSPLPQSYFEFPTSPDDDIAMSTVPHRFAWLILVLLCKLDGKAEIYKDVALSYLFLVNNLHYVVTKVRASNLQLILGEDWISKHDDKVKQYAAKFERMGWSKVLSALPNEDSTSSSAVVSPDEARNCFERFNTAFETTYRTQSWWTIPDSKLRDEIKLSICKKLVPSYRAFIEKYRAALRDDNNSNFVRYNPDDVANYISDLFYGTGVSGSSQSSSSSKRSSRSR